MVQAPVIYLEDLASIKTRSSDSNPCF